MGGITVYADHAGESLLTGLHRGTGLGPMNPLEEGCFNQLQQELSVVKDSEPATRTGTKQSSSSSSSPGGYVSTSSPGTQVPPVGSSSAMNPALLTHVIRATVRDILHSS